MSYDDARIAPDGTIGSPNLTLKQKKLVEILTQILRVASFVSNRTANLSVEKPDGHKKMMEQLAKDGKVYDKLTPEELDHYNKLRYEILTSERLGSHQAIVAHLLNIAYQDPDLKKIVDDFMNEIDTIASKETTSYFERAQKVDYR